MVAPSDRSPARGCWGPLCPQGTDKKLVRVASVDVGGSGSKLTVRWAAVWQERIESGHTEPLAIRWTS